MGWSNCTCALCGAGEDGAPLVAAGDRLLCPECYGRATDILGHSPRSRGAPRAQHYERPEPVSLAPYWRAAGGAHEGAHEGEEGRDGGRYYGRSRGDLEAEVYGGGGSGGDYGGDYESPAGSDDPPDLTGIDPDDLSEGAGDAVGLTGPNLARAPEVGFLSGGLRTVLLLWGERIPCQPHDPWCGYWQEHPHDAERMEAELDAQISRWIDAADRLDPSAVRAGDEPGARQRVYVLGQQLRTLVLLCDPVSLAVSYSYHVRGEEEPGGPRHILHELREHETVRLFEGLRQYVYAQTPKAKAKRKTRDKSRNEDPERKAADAARKRAARAAMTPEERAKEAARKRESRTKVPTRLEDISARTGIPPHLWRLP